MNNFNHPKRERSNSWYHGNQSACWKQQGSSREDWEEDIEPNEIGSMNQLCDSIGQQWCHTPSTPSVNYASPFLAIWDQYTFSNTSARQMSSTSGYPSLTDPVPGNPSSFFTNFPHRPCVASTIRIPQQTKSQDIPAVAPENHQRKKETWSTPILKTTTAEGSISSTSTSSTGLFPHSSTPVEPPVRYLSDSLSFMATKAAFVEESQVTGIKRDYQVIKAINIPWSISAADIKRILSQSEFIRIPPTSELPQCVHIMMDVKTGKTLGVAFIECKIEKGRDIKSVLYDLSKAMPVQGRHIRFNPSSYDELLSHLFSEWPGTFRQGLATLPPNGNDQQSVPFFIGQRDLQNLLNVCRNYKVYYNRKCAERPFEYLISIIMNIPWNQPRTVRTIQRDLIYECYKLGTDTLRHHMDKGFNPFEKDLLPKLVRAAIICPGFSIKQKNGILSNAKLPCPEELAYCLEEPAMLVDSSVLNIIR